MQTIVTMSKNEWEELPGKIAKAIHAYSHKEYGFKVVNKETGREITERSEDWFTGVVVTAFQEATTPKNTEE